MNSVFCRPLWSPGFPDGNFTFVRQAYKPWTDTQFVDPPLSTFTNDQFRTANCCLAGPLFSLSRVYAYAVGDGDGAAEGETAKPAQNDFQARLAMFKQKETGPSGGGT